jgi:putative ABC transport system permease protein
MDALRQDIRYGFRRLIKSPGFAIISVLTLTLGIGATSAIFSVVRGVLLKPLPYADPDRLVGLYHVSDGRRSTMSGPNFVDVKRAATTLEDASAISRGRVILVGQGEPVRLDIADVSASFFSVLGVQPFLGRTFAPDENQPGKPKVAVLGYGLWQDRFNGDAGVLGRRILLDGVPTEIVGVMPRGFSYPAGRVLWRPLEYSEDFTTKQRSAWYLIAIGRAKPGVPLDTVTAEVQAIGRSLAKQYPDANEGLEITAVPLLDATVGNIRKAVFVMFGAVCFVLLIACANVANLLLARAAARETEIAVRTALGANRLRIVRQLLTESVILSVIGAGLGLLLASWGVDLLVAMEPQGIPRLTEIRVDRVVMLFALGVSVATGLVFGMIPALHATRPGVAGSLKEGGRGALTTRSGARVRGALVVAEMALAVTLLTGAGLLIRSFVRLAAVDPGFHVQQALTFALSLPEARYAKEPQQIAFFDQLLPRLKTLPGVESAAAVIALPLSGTSLVLTFEVAGRPPLPPAQQPAMQVRIATPQYFETVGIPLRRGRGFTDRDRWGTTPVVLITESAAQQYFRGEDPIGKRITLGWGRGPGTPRAGGEVVGVIGDVKDAGLDEPDPPQIFLPYAQWPVEQMSVVLKTAVPPASLTEAARQAVYSVDPMIPVSEVRTLDAIVARSISQPRFYMTLLAMFAAVALVLAAIGIFGVLSYAVAQRTREIGIRMALGARESAVIGGVVKDAMLLTVGGAVLGVVAALFLTRILDEKMLFHTSARDAVTFTSVVALLTAVALVASYVPARRATRVDPMTALRAE